MNKGIQKTHGYTIFCDDIRDEVNGKQSLIGVYKDKLILTKPMPFNLAKLAFYIHLSLPVKREYKDDVLFGIFLPQDEDNAPSLRGGISIDQISDILNNIPSEEDTEFIHIVATVVATPVLFTMEGKITVRVNISDEVIEVGTLEIILHESVNQKAVDKQEQPTAS